MRIEPTPAEQESINALIKAFRLDGHGAGIISRPVEDKPDALLQVAGRRIACECIQIPPHYILQHMHGRHPKGALNRKPILSKLYPNEPHLWVAEAIKKKTQLHSGYLSATGASEAWLLIHSPVQANQFFVNGAREWIQYAVRHGSKMFAHPFTQVFLWTPRDGIYTVWTKERDAGTHSELGIEFDQGYPTLCYNQLSVSCITKAAHDARHVDSSFVVKDATLIAIRPKDPEYRRHKPATRPLQYHIKTRTWSDRSELTMVVEFLDGGGFCDPNIYTATNLLPETQYWHHLLHEFGAPKALRTQHAIQPF